MSGRVPMLSSGALVIQSWFPAGARLVRRVAPERGSSGVAGLGTLLGPEETGAPVFGQGSWGLGFTAGSAVRVDARGAGLVPSVA